MLNMIQDRNLDELEQELSSLESLISRARARQIELIATLDASQVATADGCRTMAEWVGARLDIDPGTARRLVGLSRHMDTAAGAALSHGEATLDRAAAVTRLTELGIPDAFARSLGFDLAGVHRWASSHRHISRVDEQRAFEERFLVLQPSLDEATWRLWGQLPGIDGRLVEQALDVRADQIPSDIGGSRAQRRADALTAVCGDSLVGSRDRDTETFPQPAPGFDVTVVVDAGLAASSSGEAGARILGGPRIGPSALAEAICGGSLAAFTNLGGQLHRVGNGGTAIPASVRRYVLARDGACVIDGCRSRHRLQVHHVRERANGGGHEPENLVVVCWYHHHIAIHGNQLRIDPASPPHRRRLIRSGCSPP